MSHDVEHRVLRLLARAPPRFLEVLVRRRKWLWIIGGGVVLIVLGTVVAPFVYIHFIEPDAPSRLTLTAGTTVPSASGGSSGGSIEGTWAPTSASSVGYRVNEVLFGQNSEAVGRTNKVTGQLVIAGTTVKTATFTVDMTSVSSDKSQRDGQFQGRIMDTATYPTATFQLTTPIEFGSVPADQFVVSVNGIGKLTMHGTTKAVTIPLEAKRNGATLEVNGSLPITFADWNIPNPSFGPVTTQDHGVLEFLLVFAKS
jgi:polyisoprenoid-binding protein YceI